MNKQRLIPLIVATALFMENMDSTVIATSLPAIAADIGTSPLTLKLAITSYLLSLAVFIPASGWTADRFGARWCFPSHRRLHAGIDRLRAVDLGHRFRDRAHPAGPRRRDDDTGRRLVLLRSIDKSALVNAMAWVTVPAADRSVIGPPLGGFITNLFLLALDFPDQHPDRACSHLHGDEIHRSDPQRRPERFDLKGLLLAGIGLAGIAFVFLSPASISCPGRSSPASSPSARSR